MDRCADRSGDGRADLDRNLLNRRGPSPCSRACGREIIDPVTGATSDSALEGNNYLPIIGAAVALIPVGLLGVFLFKFINGNVGNAKRRNKRSAFRR